MREKPLLLISALCALLALIVSAGLNLPAALAALLGAAFVLPVPLLAIRQQTDTRHSAAQEAAALLGGAPQNLLLLGADSHPLMLSKGLRQLANLPSTETALALQQLPPAWLSLIAELQQAAEENGHAWRQLWLERSAGLSPVFLSVSCLQLLGADGQAQWLLHWEDLSQHAKPSAAPLSLDQALLERSRAFIQTLIDVIPQPVYVKQQEGEDSRYILINKAFCHAYNRPHAELIGCRPQDLFDPLHASAVAKEDRAVIEGSTVFREEQAPDPVTGHDRVLIVSKQSCLSPEGQRVVVGTHFDLTPWRTTERELQLTLERERTLRDRSQSFIQRVIDTIPYPVHVKDGSSRYLIVNEAFLRERGCSREALLGRDPIQVAQRMTDQGSEAQETEQQRAALSLAEDRSILAGDTLNKEEHNFHSITGEERFRTVFKCSCLDTEGQPAIVTAMFDVTQWRIAERALQHTLGREKDLRQRTQDFIQRLIDGIPQAVYVKDAASRYLMVNEAFTHELHRERSEVVGHSSFEFAPTPEIAADSAREDAAVLAGALLLTEKRDYPDPASPPRDHIISKRLCLDVDGQPVIVCANFDITALRLAERALQEAHESPQSG